MIKLFLEKIFGSKSSKIRSKISKKHVEAMNYQRNGNIREYSRIMNEIELLEKEYERLQNS